MMEVATTRAKGTAQIVALARAISHRDPRLAGPDHLAAGLLGRMLRLVVWARPLRGLVVAAHRRSAPGGYGWVVARTRFIDERLNRELAEGVRQIVLLGAGYDTRAYRFGRSESVTFFEVDHPGTSARKRRRLARLFTTLPANVRYLSVDFETQSVSEALAPAGWRADRPTLFICEGVTPYLNARAIDALMALVAGAAPGSSVLFDYVYRSLIERTADYPGGRRVLAYAAAIGEPFRFGLDPPEVAGFLEGQGLVPELHLGPAEVRQRYLSGPNGVPLEDLLAFAGLVHARAGQAPRRPEDA
jgi:methyltransferase (TIGR00027 family)